MNLTEVLERATDQVAKPQLAGAALAEARGRRARRRAVVSAAAAVVLVVAGMTIIVASGHDEGRLEPAHTPTMAPTTGPSRGVDPYSLPLWDPHDIVHQPFARTALPELLDPPPTPPSVADRPMDAALLAWPEEGHDLRILGTDGEWRCVPGTAEAVDGKLREVVRPALSPDGAEVAMSVNDGILVVDVSTGDQHLVPWPSPLDEPTDTAPALLWLPGDQGFAVLGWRDTWIVDLDGGIRRAPFGGRYGVAIDPDGTVVEKRYDHNDLRVWRGDELVSSAYVGYWGERLVAGYGRVALTGGSGGLPGDGGPLVLDATTGDLVAHLPIRDPDALYSDNGRATALGFLDADTVLLLVQPVDVVDRRVVGDTWYLVEWSLATSEISRLSSGGEPMGEISVAAGALADE